MKHTLYTLAITIFVTGTLFTGCLSSARTSEKQQDKSQNSEKKELETVKERKEDMKASIKQFKKESLEKIAMYEGNISEFKIKIAGEQGVTKVEYEKRLKELEHKNSDMKKKLKEYREDGQDDWEIFRSGFTHTMDDLGKAIAGFFSNE